MRLKEPKSGLGERGAALLVRGQQQVGMGGV